MTETLSGSAAIGLERSCDGRSGDWVRAHAAVGGVEPVEARFAGAPFGRHRHDSYAIGLTVDGVQTFGYRGARRASLTGEVFVLHPDEAHDGAAGTPGGPIGPNEALVFEVELLAVK